jgi:flagellar biosynthesis protein FlhB
MLHVVDLMLDSSEHSNLFMESIKRWLFGLNSFKNFLRHPFKCLIFFFVTIFIDLDMLLFSWINTSIEEGFEIFLKSFLPKE